MDKPLDKDSKKIALGAGEGFTALSLVSAYAAANLIKPDDIISWANLGAGFLAWMSYKSMKAAGEIETGLRQDWRLVQAIKQQQQEVIADVRGYHNPETEVRARYESYLLKARLRDRGVEMLAP